MQYMPIDRGVAQIAGEKGRGGKDNGELERLGAVQTILPQVAAPFCVVTGSALK